MAKDAEKDNLKDDGSESEDEEEEEEVEWTLPQKMDASLVQMRICCLLGWFPVVPGLAMLIVGLVMKNDIFLYTGMIFIAVFGSLFILPGTLCGCCYFHLRHVFNRSKVSPSVKKEPV